MKEYRRRVPSVEQQCAPRPNSPKKQQTLARSYGFSVDEDDFSDDEQQAPSNSVQQELSSYLCFAVAKGADILSFWEVRVDALSP